MSLQSFRLALDAIQNWTPAAHYPNWHVLMHRAAAFVQELQEFGLCGELSRRAEVFESLTRSGSPFDLARDAVQKRLAVQPSQIHVPDGSVAVVIGMMAQAHPGPAKPWPSRVPKIAEDCGDVESIRFNLESALHDVDKICALQLSEADAKTFSEWREQILNVSNACHRDHLLGAYLLHESFKVVGDPARYQEDLFTAPDEATRARKEKLKLVPLQRANVLALKDAAAEFYRLASMPSVDFGRKNSWCHGADDRPPVAFPHGPLRGNQKELAAATSKDGKSDRRRLQRAGRDGVIWIKRYRGHDLEVWFQDKQQKAEANANLIREREAKAQKPTSN